MKKAILALIPAAALILVSCGKQEAEPNTTGNAPAAAAPATELPEGLMLTKAPEAELVTINAVKANAKVGDEVVVSVVVGGRLKPVVDNLAVMTVVESSLPNSCVGEDDHCKTPWDYCCAAKEELSSGMATVRVVDDAGKPLALNFASASIKPGDYLVVAGTVAEKNDAGNLVIDAKGIHKP